MNSKIHSPFLVLEHFISPQICDLLIQELGLLAPSLDEKGQPIKSERILSSETHLELFKPRVEALLESLEKRYDAEIVGMEPPIFQQYFENPQRPAEFHGCENSKYLRKKWVKTKDVDLVGFIWLKDFNSGVPLDPRFEMYGGKLEFPAYDFSLLPQRGTLVMYPAGPHFITAISPVLVGTLEQVKIALKLRKNGSMWLYQPANFPGSYQQWFEQEEA